MTSAAARNGTIEIAYETLGPADGEPLLLITGTGGQLLDWPEEFCRLLGERGFGVTRLDNRDAGLSTRLTDAPRPGRLTMLLRPAAAAVYRLEDMADDAVAVLDALGHESAHVVGKSQGGMIAQMLATRHPERVRSLTSINSAPAPRAGLPKPWQLMKIAKAANPARVKTREDLGQYVVNLARVTGSAVYPSDEETLREHGRQAYDRGGLDMAAIQRQTAAIVASGDRRAQLAGIRVPTLIIHGEADPLILPKAGRATADAIPDARLVTYPGMGHEVPRELWPTIVDEITTVAGLSSHTGRKSTA